jgi:peptidoglycan/LPS O-acetylase OafA/YrhL
LSVVVFHMTWETFGALLPPLRNGVTAFLLDGGLAVSVFFVLSGEALSSAFFGGGGRRAVIRLALKRYSRLTLPIIAACSLALLLYAAGLTPNIEAGRIVHRSDWLGSFLNPAPSFAHAVRYMFWDVYTSIPDRDAIIPFLWTMKFEMLGSIFVFMVLLCFDRLRGVGTAIGWLLLALIFEQAIHSKIGPLACFLAGLTYSRLRWSGFFARAQRRRAIQILSWLAILLLAAWDAVSHLKMAHRDYVSLTAVLLTGSVFCNRALCSAFAGQISRTLGRLSFPLYLVQFPVLISLTSYAICVAGRGGALALWQIASIALGSVLACLLAAYAFSPVEDFTRWVGNRIASVVPSKRSARTELAANSELERASLTNQGA